MDIFKRNERAEKIRAYKRVFESDDGKLVLKDLIASCHILTSTMDPNPNEVMFNEGARSVVLRIMRTLKVDPAELEKILNEQEKK